MRVLNRENFLKEPAGVLYVRGSRWNFEGIEIKADTLRPNDWVYLDPFWPDGKDSEEAADKVEAMLEQGTREPLAENYGRDGAFDPVEIFLVLDVSDLERLKEHCDAAIMVQAR